MSPQSISLLAYKHVRVSNFGSERKRTGRAELMFKLVTSAPCSTITSYWVYLFSLYTLRQRGQCGEEASLCASLTQRLKSQIGIVSAAE